MVNFLSVLQNKAELSMTAIFYSLICCLHLLLNIESSWSTPHSPLPNPSLTRQTLGIWLFYVPGELGIWLVWPSHGQGWGIWPLPEWCGQNWTVSINVTLSFRRFFLLFFFGSRSRNRHTAWWLVFLFRIFELETSRLESRNLSLGSEYIDVRDPR